MINKKVLIVEDNPLNRKVLEHIIGQLCDFETAENGKIALEKIQETEYDLILMDIQMPVLDGINTLKIIKSENLTNSPVIAVSAFANESDRDYFLAAGFVDFISKPIKPKILLETLDKHLKSPEKFEKNNQTIGNDTSLDEKIVRQLLKFNSARNIKSVYQEFIEESYQLLSEIESLINQKQYEKIGEKLHIIKGNSGTLGAMDIYKFSQKFEKNIKSHNFENTTEEYLYLSTLIDLFSSKIQSSQLLNP
jgi:CheY-like chemotaxis protein/HPt (histidine-containing phosphotransfer) domain-containing protein